MTESEWLSCTDPTPMIETLGQNISKRKLRLFACACCRRYWNLLTSERSRKAVEASERLADDELHSTDLSAIQADGQDAEEAAHRRYSGSRNWADSWKFHAEWTAAEAAVQTTYGIEALLYIPHLLQAVRRDIARATGVLASEGWKLAENEEKCAQASLLRDCYGSLPFRLIGINSDWLVPAVVGIASNIYLGQGFDRLPILADALEESGCADREILSHLRSEGPHVRGCFALDLILGKS